MSISVQALASGSNGNSFLISNKNEALLIDAGISRKRILESLQKINVPKENIKGILVTHTHYDHISGLPVLTNFIDAPIYTSASSISEFYRLSYRDEKYLDIAKNSICVPKDKIVDIGNFKVITVKATHDCPGTVGYRIHYKIENTPGVTVSILTDTGKLENREIWQLSRSDLILLEANYDKKLLKESRRPLRLKNRIRENHLSTTEASSILSDILAYKSSSRIKGVLLGHYSEECNSPDVIRSLVRKWEKHNEKPFKGWDWFLSPRDSPSDYLSIAPDKLNVHKKVAGYIDF
ncbi:MAG: MBL fold metallo-hydrolase [Candidatus Heimdallarchaeota archaeon]